MNKLPKSINPCPIIDAILEVRFNTDVPKEAVFGMIYQHIKSGYRKDIRKVTGGKLPEELINNNDNLKYLAHYQLIGSDHIVQLGPNVISINNPDNYLGWNHLSEIIYNIIEQIKDSGVIKSIKRLGLRYINFFDAEDILNDIELKFELNNKHITNKNTNFRTELIKNDVMCVLNVANNALLTRRDNSEHKGSIIDIDTTINIEIDKFFDNYKKFIEKLHTAEKQTFFELIKEDYLNKKLNPIY